MSSNVNSASGTLRSLALGLISSCLLLSALLVRSQAQVILDGTTGGKPGQAVGPGTTPDGLPTDHLITRQLGTLKGNNLFHSFREFSLATGKGATFTGPASVRHIISRVTGGKVSSIDGFLESTIAGADLFFINPSGVIFGPNAQLFVSGSFHVSTADYIRLGNDGVFHASHPEESLLTMSPPAAFGFLGSQPAPITIQGGLLQVQEGNTLSIVGGTIALRRDLATSLPAELQAPEGQVQIASVASSGEVVLQTPAQTPVFNTDSIQNFGELTIVDEAAIDAGTVRIRGGHLEVSNNATILADAPKTGEDVTTGIDIDVVADVVITDGPLISTLANQGDTRDIQITAGRLHLGGDSVVFSGSRGAGALGDIKVTVQQLTLVDGARLSATTSSNAPGGTVTVQATDVAIMGEASQGPNRSGIFSAADNPDSRGRGGNIRMEVGTLTIQDGGVISTTTRSRGPGGRVTITATDAVTIAGHGQVSGQPSELLSITLGPGAAGEVRLTAPRVHLAHGGTIAVESDPEPGRQAGPAGNLTVQVEHLTLTGGGQISSSTKGDGRGGTVTLRVTDTVSIAGRGSGLFSDTAGRERGGNVDLQAHTIELSGAAVISAQSTGLGDAGTLIIAASDTVLLQQGSAITTLATQAGGGNITLTGTQLVRLTESKVTAEARGEASDDRGGNVTVNSAFIILDHSLIQANAFAGNGGNITINATEAFLADAETCAEPGECLDASSQLANPGLIAVQAPVTEISSIVVPLPQRFAQATELLRQHCAERFRGGEVSSFILAGREQVPIEPDGVLPSPPSINGNMAALPIRAERLILQGTVSPHGDQASRRLWGSEQQTLPQRVLDLACDKWQATEEHRQRTP
jgi:filamentous hemagglutinin family protein